MINKIIKLLNNKYGLLKLMLNADEVKYVITRDTRQYLLPPYGPGDWQIEAKPPEFWIEFDDKIVYFLTEKDMMDVWDEYVEIKKDLGGIVL